MNRATVNAVLVAATLALTGCWTAPTTRVQPAGEPRLIQGGIAVQSVKEPAVVQSVDAGTRTIVLQNWSRPAKSTYKAGPKVSNFDRIKVGDQVEATVAEELTVYVLKNGQLPVAGGAPQESSAAPVDRGTADCPG